MNMQKKHTEKDFTITRNRPELEVGLPVTWHGKPGKIIAMEGNGQNGAKEDFCVIELDQPDENNCKILQVRKTGFDFITFPGGDKIFKEPTVKQKLESMLVSNGMFQKDAEKVIELAIPKLNELASDYKITFDRPSFEYPNVIYHLLYMVVKPIALEWIDKNRPYAWFREMFVEQIESKK